ncbi:MAG: Holliday junction branch migration protein RuvA [Clostridia bacterium]|nr:Holliday junction branch migration protein RuvA [Clostridia bacterium]
MISYIKGTLSMILEDSVVVETSSGIGFKAYVPMGSAIFQSKVGDQVKVLTYMLVKEDDMSLYGFEDKENLEMFKMLISVNGVGPKAALSIMGLGLLQLKKAIVSSDVKLICAANGIGKKTAERVILELKDRVDFEGEIPASADIQFTDARKEAVSALVNLGYSRNEALSSVSKVEDLDLSCEEYIKKALRNLL